MAERATKAYVVERIWRSVDEHVVYAHTADEALRKLRDQHLDVCDPYRTGEIKGFSRPKRAPNEDRSPETPWEDVQDGEEQ